jgi:putative glutamine amidotransferase
MKTRTNIFFLSFMIFLGCSQPPAEKNSFVSDSSGKSILIMHPTVGNLETFLYLTENNILKLPEEFKAIGVYHESASYDYQKSSEFLAEKQITNISLYGFNENLNPENLFKKNPLSDQFKELFNNSSGALFFGGPDIPPAVYNEPTLLLTVITDPNRHYFELSFLFHLLGGYQDEQFVPLLENNPEYTILGICLGMQSMNIATGGTMYQDIPSEIYGIKTVESLLAQPTHRQHRNYHTNLRPDAELFRGSFHPVRVMPGSELQSILGSPDETPNVLSSHHQALKEIGKGWRVAATCMDGIIVEAIEHERYRNVMGIQFHPEVPLLFKDEPLLLIPDEKNNKSFGKTFPQGTGENFHFKFWEFMGGKLSLIHEITPEPTTSSP